MRSAVIIDLDGTLCDCRHRVHFVKQSPPNWQAFFNACVDDTPNLPVVALYDMARDAGYAIIFISGRPDSHGVRTEDWLEQHGFDGHAALLLRAVGDYRPDAIVKRELYDAHIAGKYDVMFCVDDRNSTVAMWRSLGLACFQVADEDF